MQLIWEEFLKIIKEEAGSQVVETWFKAVQLEEWNAPAQTVTLRAPNQFVSRWIQDHYSELLKRHLARLLHSTISKINFECHAQPTGQRSRTIIPASVVSDIQGQEAPHGMDQAYVHVNFKHDRTASQTIQPATAIKPPVVVSNSYHGLVPVDKKNKDKGGNQLNEQYHFDNFVVGPSNSLAHAAAWAICENLGKVYNPLFVYGGTGLGKTHLLHAIGNEAKTRYPSLVIRYETSDNFINEFINSIRFDRAPQFRNKYQKVDLLLLDDIQFLSNKEQTQETFFHIFNVFYEHQKQIVLSSDTFPKEIAGLQSRLKSRMEWGLVADIQTPDVETKIAILTKKADVHSIKLPDEVAEFIASRVVSSIRELEGSLIRVGAFAALTNQLITLDMAKKVLLNLNDQRKEGIMLDSVLKVVAKHFMASIPDIRSKKRHQDIAAVRQVAFYMMKKLTNCSLQVIGNYVGGRDHSTVIHALTKVEGLLAKDQTLAQKLKIIEQEITSM